MTDAGAKFVDDIANLIKRKNRALPKELVIEYSFIASGKIQRPPLIKNLNTGEINRIFVNKSKLDTILADSIKIFNDASSPFPGVLDGGSGIRTGTPPAAGTFTITFPVGRYRSSKAEEKRTSGRRRLRESQEKELARLIRKLL